MRWILVILVVLLILALLAALAGSPTAREVVNVALCSLGVLAITIAAGVGFFGGNGNDFRIGRGVEDELVELSRARRGVLEWNDGGPRDERAAPWVA